MQHSGVKISAFKSTKNNREKVCPFLLSVDTLDSLGKISRCSKRSTPLLNTLISRKNQATQTLAPTASNVFGPAPGVVGKKVLRGIGA
jgi:hypothetical protein